MISPRNHKLPRTTETENEQAQVIKNRTEEKLVAEENDACLTTRTALPIAACNFFLFCNDRKLICDNLRRTDDKLSILLQ